MSFEYKRTKALKKYELYLIRMIKIPAKQSHIQVVRTIFTIETSCIFNVI